MVMELFRGHRHSDDPVCDLLFQKEAFPVLSTGHHAVRWFMVREDKAEFILACFDRGACPATTSDVRHAIRSMIEPASPQQVVRPAISFVCSGMVKRPKRRT